MQSNLLSKIDLSRSDQFKKDFKVLALIPTEALSIIPEYAYRIERAPNSRTISTVRDEAARVTGIPRSRLDHVLDLSRFHLKQFLVNADAANDDPADITADYITKLKILPEEKAADFTALLSALREIANTRLQNIEYQETAIESGLPRLRRVDTAVDVRAVFNKILAVDDDLDSYDPECIAGVPVGIITISLNDDDLEPIRFETDRRALHLLMKYLNALDKDMDAALNHIKFNQLRDD